MWLVLNTARQCKYEHGQKPNHQHYALEAAMSCDEGLEIKQHTSCVAPHIVRLLATFPASGQETARFGRDHSLPSNTRHIEAQSTAAEVLKSKDTDRSSSDGEDATLQPGPDNVIDQTDGVLRRYY